MTCDPLLFLTHSPLLEEDKKYFLKVPFLLSYSKVFFIHSEISARYILIRWRRWLYCCCCWCWFVIIDWTNPKYVTIPMPNASSISKKIPSFLLTIVRISCMFEASKAPLRFFLLVFLTGNRLLRPVIWLYTGIFLSRSFGCAVVDDIDNFGLLLWRGS